MASACCLSFNSSGVGECRLQCGWVRSDARTRCRSDDGCIRDRGGGTCRSDESRDRCRGRVATRRTDHDTNAVVTIGATEARADAAAIDAAIVRGDDPGRLAGVPFTVKDTLATAGMRATGGSLVLGDHVASTDAEFVARLRSAGARAGGQDQLPRVRAATAHRQPDLRAHPPSLQREPVAGWIERWLRGGRRRWTGAVLDRRRLRGFGPLSGCVHRYLRAASDLPRGSDHGTRARTGRGHAPTAFPNCRPVGAHATRHRARVRRDRRRDRPVRVRAFDRAVGSAWCGTVGVVSRPSPERSTTLHLL